MIHLRGVVPSDFRSKMTLQPLRFEWVAQVSLLRPGFIPVTGSTETPRSQQRDLGHPLNIRPRHAGAKRLQSRRCEQKAALNGSKPNL
jgi:hypothetical protein